MVAGPDILDLIHRDLATFTKSYRRLAEIILANPGAIIETSVKDFAHRADVSEPTVIRFCRHLGCDGYKQLKIRLTEHLAIEQVFAQHDRQLPEIAAPHGPFSAMYKTFVAAMQDMLTPAVATATDEAAKAILNCNRLIIYGLGGSSAALASEAQNRFFRLNVNAVAYSDSYMQRMSAAILSKDDVVLALSATGRVNSVIESVETARFYGAKTIAITPEGTPVADAADLCLPIRLQPDIHYYEPNPVRYAQLFAIDCIAGRVALLMGDQAREPLKRMRAVVTALRGVVPSQPLGD